MIASAALGLAIVVFVTARVYQVHYPWLSYVVSFSEAAIVGGFADWFAVVALFRYPMGIPLPHTAIIPSNKNKIAESLSDFFINNFLERQHVVDKLRSRDLTADIATYAKKYPSSLVDGFGEVVVEVLNSLDDQEISTFVRVQITKGIKGINLGSTLGSVLEVLTSNQYHQDVLDSTLKGIHKAVRKIRPSVEELVYGKIDNHSAGKYLPKRLKSSASKYLTAQLVKTVDTFVQSIENDKDHELRQEIDEHLVNWIDKLRHSKEIRLDLETVRDKVLSDPILRKYFEGVWLTVKAKIIEDVEQSDSVIRKSLNSGIQSIAEQLLEDSLVRKSMNERLVKNLSSIIESQKTKLGGYLRETIEGWDSKDVVEKLEPEVGKDLQYIRLNGTVVGGIVGLILHLCSQWL